MNSLLPQEHPVEFEFGEKIPTISQFEIHLQESLNQPSLSVSLAPLLIRDNCEQTSGGSSSCSRPLTQHKTFGRTELSTDLFLNASLDEEKTVTESD